MQALAAPATERLDVPRPISYVAKLAGWEHEECLRRLRRLDLDVGGGVLRRVGKRYFVTLGALRQHWPEFGTRMASNADVRDFERSLAELRAQYNKLAVELRVVRKRLRALEGGGAPAAEEAEVDGAP